MIIDHNLQFSQAQAVTSSTSSTNSLYLGPRGGAKPINILATVKEGFAFSGAAGGTLTIQVQSAADAQFGEPVTHLATGPHSLTTLTRGAMPLCVSLPHGCGDHVRLMYEVAMQDGSAITKGKMNAAIVEDVPTLR